MLKNSIDGYGWIAIFLHWLMAVGVFFMFGLGLYMVELSYYDAWYKGYLDLHKSLGLILFFFLAIRLFWRAINIKPQEIAGSKLEQWSAKWAHAGLYILMLILMVSGYLISTADGRAIAIFEFIHIPALPWAIENQEDIAGQLHELFAWALIVLAGMHAAAALKHQFIQKDGALIRILKAKK